jgi:hypothetical protein
MSNYAQPDYRIPVTDPRVSVQVEGNKNPLAITAPQTPYVQPGQAAPASPVANQLADALAKSKITHADGSTSST